MDTLYDDCRADRAFPSHPVRDRKDEKEGGRRVSGPTHVERVYRQLEREILSGMHAVGTHLDETEQARRLGCSRTPLREAFNQLVAVGLLARRRHCGVSVAACGPDRLRNLVAALAGIESLCVSLSAQNLSPADRALLPALAEDVGELRRVVRRGCGNPVLAETVDGLDARLAPYRPLEGVMTARRDRAAARALARAVAAGDPVAAAAVVRKRLDLLERTVARALREGKE